MNAPDNAEVSRKLDWLSEKVLDMAEQQGSIAASLKAIAGNGQPGRLGLLERRMHQAEERINRIAGLGAGLIAALTVLDVAIRLIK